MRALIAWLLFLVLVAWSGLIGALAGYGAVLVRERVPDPIAVGIAVLLVFGLALALGGRSLPLAWGLAGIAGFAAAVPYALRPGVMPGDDREAGDGPRAGGSDLPSHGGF